MEGSLPEPSYDLLLIGHPADKKFVADVYHNLTVAEGLHVFLDEESIKWGDVVFQKLNEALQKAERAVIVISKALLECRNGELNQLIGAVLRKTNSVFPILLDVSEEEFGNKGGLLAARKSLKAAKLSVETLTKEIVRLLRNTDDVTNSVVHFGHHPLAKPRNGVRSLPKLGRGFGGRDKELDSIGRHLLDKQLAVLAITGSPGVGKSMLAKAAALRMQCRGNCCVLYTNVADYETQDQFAGAILHAMNEDAIQEQEFKRLYDVIGQFQERNGVLILDGCDRAIKYHPQQFLKLLEVITPTVKVITTSCLRFDSGRLAVEQKKLSGLKLDAACHVLNGLCSGIEIAPGVVRELVGHCCLPIAIQIIGSALQTKVYTPENLLVKLRKASSDHALVEELDELAKVLFPDSSVCVAVCFETVFQLLSDNLQRQLVCLTLFKGSFTESDAAFLLGMEAEKLTSEVLLYLRQCSLLEQGQANRFRLHKLIRKYLRRKRCAQKSDRLYHDAQLRFFQLFSKLLYDAASLYNGQPREAASLYRENRANFGQLFDFNLPEVSVNYVTLALVSFPLLKASLMPEALFQFCMKCAGKAKESVDLGMQKCYAQLLVLAVDAMLDSFNPDLSKALEMLAEAKKVAEKQRSDSLIVQCHIAEARVLLEDDQKERAFRLLMQNVYGNKSLISPFDKASAFVTMGKATEDVDARSFKSALDFYQLALESCMEAVGGTKGHHPEICAIQLVIAQCFFKMEDYHKSEQTYKLVLEMQEKLSCDRLALATTLYQYSIAKACASSSSLPSVQEEVQKNFQKVSKEVENLMKDHPLLVLTPMAMGKTLFKQGMALNRKKETESKNLFEEAKKHFKKVLELSKSLSREEVDYSEVTVECLAYLTLLSILTNEPNPTYLKRCCQLTKQNGYQLDVDMEPIVSLVIRPNFSKVCNTPTTVRLGFNSKCKRGVRYAGVLSVLQRRHSVPGDHGPWESCYPSTPEPVSGNASSRPSFLRSTSELLPSERAPTTKRRSLSSAILASLVYPKRKKHLRLAWPTSCRRSERLNDSPSETEDVASSSPDKGLLSSGCYSPCQSPQLIKRQPDTGAQKETKGCSMQ